MDACAVSITNGMCKKNVKLKMSILIALTFGLFQGIMPILGYILGSNFTEFLSKYDQYIALILLSYIGIKMIKESFEKDKDEENNLTFKEVCVQGIATSIDALAVGVTLAFLNVNIYQATFLIGIVTFILCTIGVKLGNLFGSRHRKVATILGGVSLILIGCSILLEHIM